MKMKEAGFVLTAAGNTYNPSLITLRARGYVLAVEEPADTDRPLLWIACKDNRHFAAYSPPELLGLVALWEHLGAGWNQQTPDILAELLGGQP
jgi:hypothetical protein